MRGPQRLKPSSLWELEWHDWKSCPSRSRECRSGFVHGLGRTDEASVATWACSPQSQRPHPKIANTAILGWDTRRNHTASLVEVDFFESQTLQEAGDGRRGILLGGSQDTVGHGGLLELALGLLTDLGFEIRVGRHEQAGLPGIDSR